MDGDRAGRLSAVNLIVLVCVAQALVQIGAFFWPALLPGMIARWALTNSEAGWITAIFYGAYILAVPILVTLTDRVDAKRVYLAGVAMTVVGHLFFALFADGFWSALASRALAGVGWAGTYMTGLKLLADKIDAKLVSRAAAGHAASIGISGALSFACADIVAELAGWRAAFLVGGVSAALAWLLVAIAAPARTHPLPPPKPDHALFDFRPVFRNRSAMAYAIAYCIHTLEMNALRGWGVAFLGFVALATGASGAILSPTTTLTALGLLGTLASVLGNEVAIQVGRRRLISLALIASAVCASLLGFLGSGSYPMAVGLMLIYGVIVWLDSVFAHGRSGGHRRAIASWRDPRGAFDARIHRRVRGAARGRLGARPARGSVVDGLGRRVLDDSRVLVGGAGGVPDHAAARAGGRS